MLAVESPHLAPAPSIGAALPTASTIAATPGRDRRPPRAAASSPARTATRPESSWPLPRSPTSGCPPPAGRRSRSGSSPPAPGLGLLLRLGQPRAALLVIPRALAGHVELGHADRQLELRQASPARCAGAFGSNVSPCRWPCTPMPPIGTPWSSSVRMCRDVIVQPAPVRMS